MGWSRNSQSSDPTQIKSVHNEGTWSGETGNVYQQISKPVRDYAEQNTGWNETSAGVWGMLEALNDFDSRVSALVGKQMSSTQELGVLFKEDPKARKDWETFVPKAAQELGLNIVPLQQERFGQHEGGQDYLRTKGPAHGKDQEQGGGRSPPDTGARTPLKSTRS